MVIAHNLVDYTFDSTSGLGSERKRKNHVSFLPGKKLFWRPRACHDWETVTLHGSNNSV
jgi:hypothetical protein